MGLLDDVLGLGGSGWESGETVDDRFGGAARRAGRRRLVDTNRHCERNTKRDRKCCLPNGRFTKIFQRVSGKARMHTCLDQYNADKANNILGGLKWIQKGGGYYSQCNRRLKG